MKLPYVEICASDVGHPSSARQFALFCMFPKNRRKIEGSIEKEKSLV